MQVSEEHGHREGVGDGHSEETATMATVLVLDFVEETYG